MKWIIGIIVLVAVAGGGWWYFNRTPAEPVDQGSTATTQSAPDTSDDALVQQQAAIDAQLQAYDAQQ